MTSYQDNITFVPSSPKLPTILPSNSNGGSRESSSKRKDQNFSQWMGPLRRKVDYAINYSGQPHVEDIEELTKELVYMIIPMLQPDTDKQAWLDLIDVLLLVQPFSYFLKSPSLRHYVERLCACYASNTEKLFDVPIMDCLANVFPEYVPNYQVQYSGKESFKMASKICFPCRPVEPPKPIPKKLEPSFALPDGRNPYNPLVRRADDPVKYFRPKRLTMSVIADTLGDVVSEKAAAESVRKQGLSAVATASKVEFPEMFTSTVEEEASSVDDTEVLGNVPNTAEPAKHDEFYPITGKEAIELFLKHRHLHKVKFIYLNVAENRYFRPYDLISVPRDQVHKEHYIFSSFGVLHIYPDGDQSETLTLAEWNKNAVVWKAMTKLPFFRDYLKRKMFRRWSATVKWLNYVRNRKRIDASLLHAVPEFGSALLHVFRLINELSEIQFLPERPTELCHYTIVEYAADSQKLKSDAHSVLELFFHYSKKVVDATRNVCYEQLKYYENQAKFVKPLFCKESLYLARRKREARARNLQKAMDITRKLTSFITLIDQAISVHLVALARAAITRFVNVVLSTSEPEDEDTDQENVPSLVELQTTYQVKEEGEETEEFAADNTRPVFAGKFLFNRQTHMLEMQPTVAKFKEILASSFSNIFDMMCDQAYSMHNYTSKKTPQDRPGSAPPTIGGSVGSSKSSDSYEYSSVSSLESDLSQESGEKTEEAEEVEKEDLPFKTEDKEKDTPRGPNIAGLTNPDLAIHPMPSKDDRKDSATPNMLLSTGRKEVLGLIVGGQRIMALYNPLDKTKLREKLMEDPEISQAIEKKEAIVTAALNEIEEFCAEQNAWLAEIREFTVNWSDSDIEKWKGQPARDIEDQLNKIKNWTLKVQNMDHHLLVSNRLLYVDGRYPMTVLVPALNHIFKRLINMTIAQAKAMSTEVSEQVKDALKILKNKDTSMKSFAAYARKVTECVKRKEILTNTVAYTRALFEVVRMSHRQLTQEEEKLDEKVKSSWEAFLFQLKDATSFVTNQRPVIKKQLDEMFNMLRDQAQAIAAEASSDPICDPYANPAEVVDLLKDYIAQYQEIRSKITEVNHFHEAICDESYPLEKLKQYGEEMNNKLNLWQYVNVSNYTINDWKATIFRKFNAQHALNRINEWRVKAVSLIDKLPPGDAVLQHWQETLEGLAKELPLLHKLSREAMKARHWRAVFTGMGETFEAGWTFTIEEMLSYHPSMHARLIHRVYQDAASEYSLEKLLRSIKKEWDERHFHLAKHIYVVKLPQDEETAPAQASKPLANPRSSEKVPQAPVKLKHKQMEKDSETYILVGVQDLLKDLSESHVTLQAMLQSRHAVEVKQDAEIWSDTLRQIGEIIHLWVTCQDKWMYLNRVFNGEANLAKKFPSHADLFLAVDQKYKDFINSMLLDAKVLSVLSRRHGQRGWRDLQGETLRKHLVSCIKSEDEILEEISSLLGDFRSQFPRLYFLCDDDCVRLLGISRQPKGLVPYVKKCFKGASSLLFNLPHTLSTGLNRNSNSSLDLELHSHKLQATYLVGENHDCLRIEPLSAHSDANTWLAGLERRIKSSLVEELKECVECRLNEKSLSLGEASQEVYEADAFDTSPQDFSHWILRFTIQTVLLTDAILWYRKAEACLKHGKKKGELEDLKKATLHQFKQLVQVLQDNTPLVQKSALRLRFQSILSALITQTAYHREILRPLESDQSVDSEASFLWQRLIKHKVSMVDYSSVDMHSYECLENRPATALARTASVGHCYVEQLGHREEYGYEYMGGFGNGYSGVCVGTVYTPVTEKCMLDLWLSVRMGQCAGLFGPTGVGKSSILQQLAQVFGRQFVNLNCSEQMTIKTLKRCLCGMVESGSWLCFDHANQLTEQTLAMLSQHIKHIHQTYAVVKQATNTQYTVRGSDECNKLKRSHSVTTLHETLIDGTATAWHPQVSKAYIRSLEQTHFEDYDADTYFQRGLMPDRPVGSIIFSNRLLRCQHGFAAFMTFNTANGSYPAVPDCLKLSYRPTSLVKPDVKKLLEVWLQAAGFNDSANLSTKLRMMYETINSHCDHIGIEGQQKRLQASFTKLATLHLATLKSIISIASVLVCKLRSQQRSRSTSVSEINFLGGTVTSSSSSMSSSSRASKRSEVVLANHNEEVAIVDAILNILPLKLASPHAVTTLKETLRNIFPLTARSMTLNKDNKLAVAVQNQMLADGLQLSDEWINKVCQLHAMLKLHQSVVIAGQAGSGKTTLFRLLSKALNTLSNETTISRIILNDYGDEELTQNYNLPPPPQQEAAGIPKGDSSSNVNAAVSSMSDIFVDTATSEKSGYGYGKPLQEDVYTRIDLTVLYPNAYGLPQLFGCYENKDKIWKQGILVKLLKECSTVHKSDSKQDVSQTNSTEAVAPSAGRKQSAASALLRKMPSLRKWLILDGEILPTWVDNINCLLDGHKRASMSNMEELHLSDCTNIIFEASDFSSASPAIATRCGIVHCKMTDSWHSIASSWFDTAYNQYAITQHCVSVWRDLTSFLVPKTLQFLSERRGSVLTNGLSSVAQQKATPCTGVHEITSFISILQSCMAAHRLTRVLLLQKLQDALDKRSGTHSRKLSSVLDETQSTETRGSMRSRMESVPESHFQKALNVYGFAFVWAFGGSLLADEMPAFDQFVRNAFRQFNDEPISFPRYETVFDYYVEDDSGKFSLWEDKIDLRPRGPVQDTITYSPIHQFERYAYLSQCLLSSKKSVLFVGEMGCGKTSLVKNMLQTEMEITKISITPGLAASHFQRLVESKASPTLKQHNLGLMAHPSAIIASRSMEPHHALFFLDDLSCAGERHASSSLGSGTQPVLELLRQIIGINGIYEQDRLLFKSLESELAFVATCALPSQCGAGLGSAQHPIPPRLVRNFTVLNFLKPTREAILSMYHHSVQSWLEEFPAYSLTRHYDLSQAIIAGAYDLYTAVCSQLKPSPRQPHYVFSLHDISKIMQGLFLLKPRARGRPIPLRHRGGGTERMKRPKGGKPGGKNKSMRDLNEPVGVEVLPLMRTVARLWLHECCRVFQDRLVDEADRSWLCKSIHDTLKKQFCTGKAEQSISPDIDKVRIIKTPIPSGAATPPNFSSSSNTETTESLNITQESETSFNMANDSEMDASTLQGTEYLSGSATESEDDLADDTHEQKSELTLSEGSLSKQSGLNSEETFSSEKVRSSASATSSVGKVQFDAVASISSGKDSTDLDEFMSETTTPTRAGAGDAEDTTTDDYDWRGSTALTGEEDTQSAVTGYTTEAESVFETESTVNETTETESTTTASSKPKSGKLEPMSEENKEDQVIFPSSGKSEKKVKKGRPGRAAKPSRPGGAKLGVTFVPGLIEGADESNEIIGPLLPYDQVLDPNEEINSIIFSQSIISNAVGHTKSTGTYGESTVAQLTKALKICLEHYNESQSSDLERMNLVFFEKAVHHAARLSRILFMRNGGGHALLLSSTQFVGRHSLVKIIAYLNSAKTYLVSNKDMQNLHKKTTAKEHLRKIIKEASMEAGLKEMKVILLLEEDISRNPVCLDDICALVRDGQCPALYSYKELANVATSISSNASSMPSNPSDTSVNATKLTSQEKLDSNLNLFFSRVLANLHVIVLASYPGLDSPHDLLSPSGKKFKNSFFHDNEQLKSFHQFLRRSPDLLTRFSCVDLYVNWEHHAWQIVTKHFLKEANHAHYDDIPWTSDMPPAEQLHRVSHLMAYIHQDAVTRLKASRKYGASVIVSPSAVRQMVQLFVGIAMKIKAKETKIIDGLRKALFKVFEGEDTLEQYETDRDKLVPKLENAKESEKSWKQLVEQERAEYTEARERCGVEEEIILLLEAEVDDLKRETKQSFDMVNPMYAAALKAADALSQSCLDEVKRYKYPPKSAVAVVTCLCHIFRVSPANWENGKALIGQENFYMDLEYYDKDHIPEDIYRVIKKYVCSPQFKVSYVQRGSIAASKLCAWIHAIYHYGKTKRRLQPKINKQRETEARLYDAERTLGEKRVKCNKIKDELDSKIQEHKTASVAVKQYERNIRILDGSIHKAKFLIDNMKEYIGKWRDEKRDAVTRLGAAVGDAVVVAACVVYYGPLVIDQRALALKEWIKAATNGWVDQETQLFDPSKRKRLSGRRSGLRASSFVQSEVDSILNEMRSTPVTPYSAPSAVSSAGNKDDTNQYFLKVREDLSLIDILSTPDELRSWHRNNLPRNEEARFNALRIHAMSLHQNAASSFIFDPDDEAQMWLTAIFDKLREDLEQRRAQMVGSSMSLLDSKDTNSSSKESLEILDEDDDADVSLSAFESSTSQCNKSSSSQLTKSSTSQINKSSSSQFSKSESTEETEIVISVTATTFEKMEKPVEKSEDVEETKSQVRFTDASDSEKELERIDEQDLEEKVQEEIQLEEDTRRAQAETPCAFPLNKLWVCTANDPMLPGFLRSAMAHGAFLLITHVERAIPENITFLEKLDSHPSLTTPHLRHPFFRLFLSTSIPLRWGFRTEKGKFTIPLDKFSVSNMALTDEGIKEKLEYIVLAQERSEFEAQRRLMEADIFHLEEHMDQLHDQLLANVAEIGDKVLSDTTLLPELEDCKRDAHSTDESLKETKAMERNLVKKKSDLEQVAQHGLMLYQAIDWTSSLDAVLYHMTASQFIALFSNCISSRKRGKGGISAMTGSGSSLVKTRVVELCQSLTEVILRYVGQTHFQSDVIAFTTFVSLNLLCLSGKLSQSAMEEFLETKHVNVGMISDEYAALPRPNWIDPATWQDILAMEQRHVGTFGGLSHSMASKPKRWKEYFNSPPILLTKVPSGKLYGLSIGEKAYLWKVLRPDKISQIASDLNSCVIGGITSSTYIFDLELTVSELTHQKPCVFILPPQSEDSCFILSHHVGSIAKSMGCHLVERSALYEGKLSDVLEDCMVSGTWLLIDDCHLIKRWPSKFVQLLTSVIGKNPDPEEEEGFTATSVHITNRMETIESKGDISRGTSIFKIESSMLRSNIFSSSSNETAPLPMMIECHRDFRLWMITKKDKSETALPTIVLQHAQFIALETPFSHKDLVKKTHYTLTETLRSVPPPPIYFPKHIGPSYLDRIPIPYNIKAPIKRKTDLSLPKRQLILQLSLLHSILLERATFRRSAFAASSAWTDGELIDALRSIMLSGRSHKVAEELCCNVMTRHLGEPMDVNIVKELFKQCFAAVFPEQEKTKNVYSHLIKLLKSGETTIDHIFNRLMQKPDLAKLGLEPYADQESLTTSGNLLSAALMAACQYKAVQRGLLSNVGNNMLVTSAQELNVQRGLENLRMQLKETPRLKLNCGILSIVMLDFYASEVERLNTVISMLQSDVELCIFAVKNRAEMTEEIEALLQCFVMDRLADQWLECHSELFRFHTSQPLSDFIKKLSSRVMFLTKYMEVAVGAETSKLANADLDSLEDVVKDLGGFHTSGTQTLFAYNLAVFTRPDVFLRSALFSVARAKLHDAHKYTYDRKFLSDSQAFHPTYTKELFETIYIEGLRLHKALYDKKGEILHQVIESNPQAMPLLQLTAVKSARRIRSAKVTKTQTIYDCPVWVNAQRVPPMCASDNVLMHVPLATDTSNEEWTTKGVSITCALSDK